ncbi:MAG: hypothetical protein PQ612_10310 [Rickettsiales bacterium]|nr:hypothetical protein [Pseudomonadota bacterium]MDA0967392.1 hypothetical protein [Pseudomonadota bacterium]MDG4544415.1 hypothetical protein [Rickettsiales bacterium]MDG4546545.1 hypothetical protein [Rickettsiales bacterium]MDG4548691.1 hypothetical protein [Rickettsiales bacterium]
MNIKQALAGMLLLSAATSQKKVEATAQIGLEIAASRGFCTGMICAGIKGITSNIKDALSIPETDIINLSKEQPASNNNETAKKQNFVSKITKGVLNNFPLDFGANAVATTYVDRLFGTKTQTVSNIKSLALPIATMKVAKEIIKDANIPPIAKSAIIYGGFWAGRISQGKHPLTTAAAVGGFAAGASFIKSFNNKTTVNSDEKQVTRDKPEKNKGLYVSAVTGFMPSSVRKISDNAKDSAEDQFKESIGVPKETKLWPMRYDKFSQRYTDYLVPISDEEYKSMFR